MRQYTEGEEISEGSFTGTFVKMADCDNQIMDFATKKYYWSYKNCEGTAYILIDREVGAVWVCPTCKDDGGYTGGV
tara:strand:- start:148 stop:375 length:228 start_codon:yes stop_codon:yes gene_type:complete